MKTVIRTAIINHKIKTIKALVIMLLKKSNTYFVQYTYFLNLILVVVYSTSGGLSRSHFGRFKNSYLDFRNS